MPEHTPYLDQWLQEGIAAAKAGEMQTARFRLLDIVEQDQTNEAAWYWLYHVFDRVDDRRTCLENLILLNPDNQWAKEELLKVLESLPPTVGGLPPEGGDPTHRGAETHEPLPHTDKPTARGVRIKPSRPVTLKLVTAFWAGISTIFLGSGIISCGVWLFSRLDNQNLPDQNAQLFQSLELVIGIIFAIVGTLGFYIAVMLFFQSMIGFYGSILLSLALLLVGPTASLITTPPNYATMICTGGISGMIVLLTLASQPGFEKILQDDNITDQTK